MDWNAKVELFEQLRQEHEFGVGTIAGVAAKFGVHRRMVRQAIAGALPPSHRYPVRIKPKLDGITAFIDQILDEDRRAPRKQRHTARRIYRRILKELPDAGVGESTVRNHVRARKRALGLVQRETFVPQSYTLGQEAQVDWYEAWADLGGERTKLQVFAMRSMGSGAAFHRAYLHATQQAFLEAHELAFDYFGGVFRLLRYDNLASAVRKILRGHRRKETVRFIAFRSHWRFTAEFCTPGEGHEKGGVEGEGGYFRRNHLVPVPSVADLDALNALLLTSCRADETRILDGRTEPVGMAMVAERDYLLERAPERFDLADVTFPLVDKQGCVTVKTNAYSVPIQAGTRVEARVHPLHVEIWHSGHRLARHERCHRRRQQVLDLEHYLDVLGHKPGALAGSKPLAQWRAAGRWPACYDELWERLRSRHGNQNGTRAMVAVVALGREFGHDKLRVAITTAVSLGACDVAAVRYLLTEAGLHKGQAYAIDVGELARYDRPMPTMAEYDALLSGPYAGNGLMSDLQEQAIRQHCKALRMPTIGGQFARLADAATREGHSHVGYLEALLAAEMEERESRAIARLLNEARLPRMKTLDAFEFDRSGVAATQLRTLAEGDYVTKAEPILLVGDAGTGKTHLATGLCVAACRQRRRVRFTTATALVNELAEAAHANQLSRALGRWERLDLICIDELGYVPLAETACELMFQVIADRAEKAAVIVTTNLPFSEWSQVIPNPRLCKAMIDRLTDRAHIITTGTDSYRFRRTTAQRKASKG